MFQVQFEKKPLPLVISTKVDFYTVKGPFNLLPSEFRVFNQACPLLTFKMELFFNPFDSLLCILLGISFTVWFTLLLVFIIVPAILGVSFGIRRLYMKSLLKIFEVMEPFCAVTLHLKPLTLHIDMLEGG